MSAEGAVVMENKNKSLHEGHRQRLRKRFRNDGLDNFEQHEVLELVLQYSIYQKMERIIHRNSDDNRKTSMVSNRIYPRLYHR